MGEEVEAAGGESADPAGVALVLAGASQAEADAYLRDQRHHSGHGSEAKAEFSRAAALDLTPSEKLELAGMAHV